ncbi:MAG: chromosome partitioning protein ParA, partial [Spirochaeta sp.]
MQSAFYRGHVRHSRFQPVEHSFRFPLCMAYLDLDEV